MEIFKFDLYKLDTKISSYDQFVMFWNTIKISYHPLVATFCSQFTALYPYIQNLGNTCISNLYD